MNGHVEYGQLSLDIISASYKNYTRGKEESLMRWTFLKMRETNTF